MKPEEFFKKVHTALKKAISKAVAEHKKAGRNVEATQRSLKGRVKGS